MATAAQLKAIRKKYGLGEFKNRKKRRHNIIKFKRGVKMKRRKSSRKSSGFGSGIWAIILGALGYILYDLFVSPMIPVNGMAKNLVELGVGLFFMRKGGIIGGTAKTAVVLNTYQLLLNNVVPLINK